ncbi:unnamed protein product, partial [Meganyctiphanes norvegica]
IQSSAMVVIIWSLLMVVGVWADQLPVNPYQDVNKVANMSASVLWPFQKPAKPTQVDSEIPNEGATTVKAVELSVKLEKAIASEVTDNGGSGCDFPFEAVGSMCYYFSDEQRNFDEASNFCASLSHGHNREVTLAMLDYSTNEDQALLDAASARDASFWVGGATEDNIQWKWQDGRDIYLQARFWGFGEPNNRGNKCTATQVTTNANFIRSYIYDTECMESLNFICQQGCPSDFRRIGNSCYFLSHEVGLDKVHWQDARDYCRSLVVPEGYYADLAVLGLPGQDDYRLMYEFCAQLPDVDIWLGAFAETECEYKWIDGRTLASSSIYWVKSAPYCGDYNHVAIYNYSSRNQTYLIDFPDRYTFPFVCQMFQYD